MYQSIKTRIKKGLARIGLLNPALGVKISQEAKASMLLKYKPPGTAVFIETGTNYGDMLEMVGHHFKRLYSIELNTDLYEKVCKRFEYSDNLTLIKGDSGIEIRNILTNLHEPALFWLDAHGTGAMSVTNPVHCPVENELKAIFEDKINAHTILIDDVRHYDSHSVAVFEKLAKMNGYSFKTEEGLFILKR